MQLIAIALVYSFCIYRSLYTLLFTLRLLALTEQLDISEMCTCQNYIQQPRSCTTLFPIVHDAQHWDSRETNKKRKTYRSYYTVHERRTKHVSRYIETNHPFLNAVYPELRITSTRTIKKYERDIEIMLPIYPPQIQAPAFHSGSQIPKYPIFQPPRFEIIINRDLTL